MTLEESARKYNELFDSIQSKADAFDLIAERYYYLNFGTTSKSDFDVLMFSLYLEQILKKDQYNMSAYSDYTLSKSLGITQSKVESLKVKKELKYPYEDFNWQEALLRICDNAVYEDGKVKLFVPDKCLYLEIKNAIETCGGYVEVQLTSNLLQVRLQYFLDLMVMLTDESSRDAVRQHIKDKIKDNLEDVKIVENEPFGKALAKQAPEIVTEIIKDCIPGLPGIVTKITEIILKKILNS